MSRFRVRRVASVAWRLSLLEERQTAALDGFTIRVEPSGMWMATRQRLRIDACGADARDVASAQRAALWCVRWFTRHGRWPGWSSAPSQRKDVLRLRAQRRVAAS